MSSERRPGYLWAIVQEWMDAIPYPPSQRKLAARIGVSASAVSDWKYGDGFPEPDALRRLGAELGVPYERVLDAVLKDRGYRSPDSRGVEEHADRSAANKKPETGPAKQPVLRDVSDLEADVAARHGRKGSRRSMAQDESDE